MSYHTIGCVGLAALLLGLLPACSSPEQPPVPRVKIATKPADVAHLRLEWP